MNSHILTYLASARQHLQQLASQETDPITLIQLAEAHAALNRARELWDAGAVAVSDGETSTCDHPDFIRVDDGRESYLVTVACSQDRVPWGCRCAQTARAYRGVCAHIAAAHFLCVDEAHRAEVAARGYRRLKLEQAATAYMEAVAAREALQVVYRQAQECEAQRFAAYREFGIQVQLDEQNAAMEQQAMTAQTTSMEVAA